MPDAQQRQQAWSKVVDRPRSEVWDAAIPNLGKQYFVINNLDKASGLINLSYSGDPERFVDCGRITSTVTNLRGDRGYDFAASKAQQNYELMDLRYGLQIINRRMSLEGRTNLVFEAIDANRTKVTANVRYVLTRKIMVYNGARQLMGGKDGTISFNSGQVESFPPDADSGGLTCVPTGALERDLLSAVN
ncbi:MAG: hypothetical protein C0423_13930 [Methylibium sp.]|nr:hypothetical protein [Methylibium sp.]